MDKPDPADPDTEEPEGGEAPDPDEQPSGGTKDRRRTGAPGPTGGSGEGEKPTGGTKGEDPTTEEPGTDPSEPAPTGRPQVTPDDGEPGSGDGTGDDPGGDTSTPIGTGEGVIDDPGPGRGFAGTLELAQVPGAGDSGGSGGGADGAPGGDTAGAIAGDTSDLTLAADPAADAPGGAETNGDGDGDGNAGSGKGGEKTEEQNIGLRVLGPFQRAAERVPDWLWAALAGLAALSILLGFGYLFSAMRARRLARQRRELLQEVGLLQHALLPPVPDRVGALRTSVAYRPADGPGAGGDFYDVLPLPGGRVGFILGDVSGHGRGALARTAFMRYTLRAYLEAGLEPRVALQVAGRVIDDNLGGDFATVLLAVHDPETGSLTYAAAGHPAPIVVGPQPHEPVTAGSSPPIGVGVRTGLRQTTVPLVPGSVACLFTDGLMEARTEDGILGRERLAELLDELGDDASARRLIESVASESSVLSDDMAAVVVSPTAGVTAGLFRTEQLELSARELEGPIAGRFLEACGLPAYEVEDAEHDARLLAERFGGVVLHVVFGNRLRVEVLPRNVESIEAASRRVTAGSAQ